MSVTNTIWATLSPSFPAPGGVLFIGADGQTTWINSLNFWFNPNNYQLSVATNGDQTGTDAINVYGDIDAYAPVNTTRLANGGKMNGNAGVGSFSVSSSRGVSGVTPALVQNGDYVGKYSFWAYTNNPDPSNFYQSNYGSMSPLYVEIGYIGVYTSGNTGSAAGIGGYMAFAIKADNNIETEVLLLNPTALYPSGSSTLSLGMTGAGWTGFFLSYNVSNIPATASTINTPTGRVQLLTGNSTYTITSSLVTSTSIVHTQAETVDSGGAVIAAVSVTNGSFTVTMSKNVAAPFKFTFVVFGN
jgi:hypothetical protein